jgi:hypothetical protein
MNVNYSYFTHAIATIKCLPYKWRKPLAGCPASSDIKLGQLLRNISEILGLKLGILWSVIEKLGLKFAIYD